MSEVPDGFSLSNGHERQEEIDVDILRDKATAAIGERDMHSTVVQAAGPPCIGTCVWGTAAGWCGLVVDNLTTRPEFDTAGVIPCVPEWAVLDCVLPEWRFAKHHGVRRAVNHVSDQGRPVDAKHGFIDACVTPVKRISIFQAIEGGEPIAATAAICNPIVRISSQSVWVGIGDVGRALESRRAHIREERPLVGRRAGATSLGATHWKREIDLVIQRSLVDVGQQEQRKRDIAALIDAIGGIGQIARCLRARIDDAGREDVVGVVVVVQRQAQLLHVVAALGAPGRLARLLNRREQQGDQDCDDRNHDQQFNECETTKPSPRHDEAPRNKVEAEKLLKPTERMIWM